MADKMRITDSRVEEIDSLALEIKSAATVLYAKRKVDDTFMLVAAIAMVLVETNYEFSQSEEGVQGDTLEPMLDAIRELHRQHDRIVKATAAAEAAEARKEGRIQ